MKWTVAGKDKCCWICGNRTKMGKSRWLQQSIKFLIAYNFTRYQRILSYKYWRLIVFIFDLFIIGTTRNDLRFEFQQEFLLKYFNIRVTRSFSYLYIARIFCGYKQTNKKNQIKIKYRRSVILERRCKCLFTFVQTHCTYLCVLDNLCRFIHYNIRGTSKKKANVFTFTNNGVPVYILYCRCDLWPIWIIFNVNLVLYILLCFC